ncbi:MAG TPA: glycogen-binding domain-containing protein [Gemmatimonadaceae bacterium]|nr:glycogen-binding domain-containing protein [Gemmatimonadaceae bacterium]
MSIAYDSVPRTVGMTVAPALRLASATAALDAAGGVSLFNADSDGWSAQGTLDGSAFTPTAHGLRGEVVGVVGGSRFESGASSAEMLGQLRVHLLRRREGAWVMLGGGEGWDGTEFQRVTLAGAGAWLRRGSVVLAGSVNPAATSGERYTDATGTITWNVRALELEGSLNVRRGGDGLLDGTWGEARATLWLSRHLALVTGWGSYAPDPVQALPGGRYLTMTLRLGTRPVHYPALRLPRHRPAPIAPGVARDIQLHQERDGRCVITVRVPDARRVELMGDFTDWSPVALESTSPGVWVVALHLSPGAHHYNVRIDGGEWTVPAESPSVADEFNGRVGVLLVR